MRESSSRKGDPVWALRGCDRPVSNRRTDGWTDGREEGRLHSKPPRTLAVSRSVTDERETKVTCQQKDASIFKSPSSVSYSTSSSVFTVDIASSPGAPPRRADGLRLRLGGRKHAGRDRDGLRLVNRHEAGDTRRLPTRKTGISVKKDKHR
ncbi:hypothetical protein EYF80_012906 [Liparis tanakae]|uniref:Uncharacterized protein n=1 Tax=Liparis tanakae TaxID=230148 RepID=A0A4Z2II34_9TELE|nr:hypothetical protein EYF80_012906 [Liparis tanakae]